MGQGLISASGAARPNSSVSQHPVAVVKNPAPSTSSTSTPYDRFGAALRSVKRNPDVASRGQFLEFFARDFAPSLRLEEPALQLMAVRLSGLYMEPGHAIALDIDGSWEGHPVHAYGQRNVIIERLNDTERGCLAFRLRPEGHGRSIILFAGTANTMIGDVLALQHFPLGFRADYDPKSVAYEAFAANAATLLRWVREEHADGREVLLLGHSLGGALAMRTMAALSPDEQARTQLMTVFAPGVDGAAAQAVVPGRGNVRHVSHGFWSSLDPVPLAGEAFPAGTWYEVSGLEGCTADREFPHGTSVSAAQLLDGKPLRFSRTDRGVVYNQGTIEALRAAFGAGFGWRLPA